MEQIAAPRESLGKTTWGEVHPYAKTAIILTASGIVVFGLYQGYKAYNKWQGQKESRKNISESKDELKDLAQAGIKPSYSDSQYLNWAQSLQQQFDGCGTGVQKLYPIYESMKNDADINKLIIAYGTRTVDKCGIGTGDFSGDLTSTMAYKFSGVEGAMNPYAITVINGYFNARKLKFRF